MKFRLKLMLYMAALLSVLFGAGGSLLITGSFHDALEREKEAAFASYRMAWSALQIVNGLDPYLDRGALVQTMEQLCAQGRSAWTALRLSAGEETIYESNAALSPLLGGVEPTQAGSCRVQIAAGQLPGRYLILSGTVETNGETLCLQTAQEISAPYDARQSQLENYLRVFAVLAVLCAVLSYTTARVLTAPLVSLSLASRAIASGRFSSRVRVRSRDEVGAVGEDFNAMAEQMERTVAQLQQAVERQERFVGSFAHEMKTPMTALIGYAELLRSGTLSPGEQREAAGYIYSESKRLENLSRKLLDLLVLKQGDLPLVEVSPAA